MTYGTQVALTNLSPAVAFLKWTCSDLVGIKFEVGRKMDTLCVLSMLAIYLGQENSETV